MICDSCESYICGLCNLFIPEEKVKVNYFNDTEHLERIFDKHLLKCKKLTIDEQFYIYNLKYCLGCKIEYNLIDKIHSK